MGEQSPSAHFQPLLESAFQAYEKQTNIALAEHPFVVELQSCHSVESITATLFQGQEQAFSNFQESDRIMKSIKTTVSNLTTHSATSFLGDTFGLVRQNLMIGLPHLERLLQELPPANALLAALAILLDVRAALS